MNRYEPHHHHHPHPRRRRHLLPPFFFLPETTDPSEQKSRHMATGHGRLDSQMHCACVCKTLHEIHYTGKPVRKRMALCVCVCVCVCRRAGDKQKNLIQTDHVHRNRWQTQGLPSLFFFSPGSACRRGSTVQVSRVRQQTEGPHTHTHTHTLTHTHTHTHTDVAHAYTQTYISVGEV